VTYFRIFCDSDSESRNKVKIDIIFPVWRRRKPFPELLVYKRSLYFLFSLLHVTNDTVRTTCLLIRGVAYQRALEEKAFSWFHNSVSSTAFLFLFHSLAVHSMFHALRHFSFLPFPASHTSHKAPWLQTVCMTTSGYVQAYKTYRVYRVLNLAWGHSHPFLSTRGQQGYKGYK
jgi:hypothetical protein